ncbi:MAG TPA: hypothetical protein PKE45_20105, partial [Caldilineaceae bacterium]|nr:hypothetical protein [Caldilineaceae bacterium]
MTTGIEVDSYIDGVCEQRRRREAMLREERSWLTLAGLFWLQPVANRFGRSPDNDLVLPGATTPDHAGLLILEGGEVPLEAPPGLVTSGDGQTVPRRQLLADDTASPDYLSLATLTILVIKRKARVGVRVWDAASPARAAFGGLRWHPIRPEYCLTARFTPYDPLRPLPIVDVLGDEYIKTTPGYVCFDWQGGEYRLDA